MKERLLYYLDRLIYVLKDTLPDPARDDIKCYKSQKKEIEELEKIREWFNNQCKVKP